LFLIQTQLALHKDGAVALEKVQALQCLLYVVPQSAETNKQKTIGKKPMVF
jgi:hypothetical protein